MKITILTPTFNRANFILRIYESLILQTNFSFEWLLIDDGSTDNTEEILHEIKKKHIYAFDISYIKKRNGGKQSALNYSHPYINGNYVMVLDSDDFLPNDSVEIILEEIASIPKDKKIGWLAFLKGNSDGTSKDSPYEVDGEITNYITYMNRGRIGECCDIYLKEVFISYPYIEIKGEKFISESILNIKAALYGNYEMITFNKVVQVVEYLEEGLTLQGRALQIKNPKGHAELWRHVNGNRFNLKQNLKGAWLYIAYSFFAGTPLKTMIQKSSKKAFILINIPFGYAIYLIWKCKYI